MDNSKLTFEDFRNYRDEYLRNIEKRVHIKWQVILIWQSPIAGEWTSRTAFFCERAEADIYNEMLKNKYDELGYKYILDIVPIAL